MEAPDIRPEEPRDRRAIHALLSRVMPGPGEAKLVDRLREDGDLMVSLVAELDGRIVGHIALSPATAVADHIDWRAAGLAPVAVLPEHQNHGIGSALIRAALASAQEDHGIQILFVLGDPAYYGRFGFAAATAAPFESPYAGPAFQALLLEPALDLPAAGRAGYAPAFDLLNGTDAP